MNSCFQVESSIYFYSFAALTKVPKTEEMSRFHLTFTLPELLFKISLNLLRRSEI